jgi:hypothetical protein
MAQFNLTPPTALIRCEDNPNLIHTFDLTVKNQEILSNLNPASYTIIFFETQADAQANTNPILNPTAYQNTTNPQTLYIRIIGNQGSNNYGFSSLVLAVFHTPVFYQPPNSVIYQNPYTGQATFDFNRQERIMTANQPGVIARVYLTEADALADTNPIQGCFTNTLPEQTLWGRAFANFEGGCFSVFSFTVTVSSDANPNPVVLFPDNNFKTKLLQADTTNTVASNFCSQHLKIDTNNDGEIQTDEAERIFELYVNGANISSMEGITAFSRLNYLHCANNLLQELHVNGMKNLYGIECYNNQLTSLDLSDTPNTDVMCYNNNITYLNLKNGMQQFVPIEYPANNWSNNPLNFVCADANELENIGFILMLNQYGNTVTVSSDCALGVNENQPPNPLKIYPNPTAGLLTIECESIINSIQLLDLQGRKLKAQQVQDTTLAFDMTTFTQGVYLLKITTNSGERVERVVKK